MSFDLYNLDKDYPIKIYQLYIRYKVKEKSYNDNVKETINYTSFYCNKLDDCFSRLQAFKLLYPDIVSFSVAELKGFPIEHDDLIQLLKEYNDEI